MSKLCSTQFTHIFPKHLDFAIIGDAEATIEDGILVLRVDLRPAEAKDA